MLIDIYTYRRPLVFPSRFGSEEPLDFGDIISIPFEEDYNESWSKMTD